MHTNEALFQERTLLFQNALNHRHNKRVPLFSNVVTWKYLHYGYKLDDILRNYDLVAKANADFHREMQFDAYMDIIVRNPMKIPDALGLHRHQISEDGEAIEIRDDSMLQAEDYQLINQNFSEALWTKVMPKCCKEGLTMGELKAAVNAYFEMAASAEDQTEKTIHERDCLVLSRMDVAQPMDTLFAGLRGIKDLSMDMRKNKSALKETLEILWQNQSEGLLDAAFADPDYTGYIAPVQISPLAHSVMNPKQFGEFYYPYMKKTLDAAISHHVPVVMYVESFILHLTEYFEDIPKGTLMMVMEQDDLVEVRKKLPNITLCGGMPANMLGHESKEACIDYAKYLIDTLGDGFVLSQNKMLTFRNDAKAENLLAVNEFARNYSC